MKGNVYLVGMPGSGKSRVGRELSGMTGLPMIDIDKEIEEEAGMPALDIFEMAGEQAFRDMEKAALVRASARNRAIVSCGGGAVLDPDNRAVMKASGMVIWLKAPVERLKERAPAGGKRPLLRAEGDMERLLAERTPVFQEVSDEEIDVGDDPVATARIIARMLS